MNRSTIFDNVVSAQAPLETLTAAALLLLCAAPPGLWAYVTLFEAW
jgi:hypothetical protein